MASRFLVGSATGSVDAVFPWTSSATQILRITTDRAASHPESNNQAGGDVTSPCLATRAIEIDPAFARAYTLRARTLLWRLWLFCDLTDDQWRMMGNDIESARRLEGDTAGVLAAQVESEYYGEMDYPRALETVRAALVRYPNDPDLRCPSSDRLRYRPKAAFQLRTRGA